MLVECKKCGKEFSNKAHYCPNCGCNIENKNNEQNQKRKTLKCPVGIKGDEVLGMQPMGFSKKILYFLMGFITLITFIIMLQSENEIEITNIFITILILAIIYYTLYYLFWIVSNILPPAMMKRKRAKQIYEYYKLKYPILREMKDEYTILGVFNIKNSNKNLLLFNLYQQADNKNADAIVINSESTTSHSYGNVTKGSGAIYSKSEHHITATLVKY